jgi:hypothetical protein
MRCAGVNSIRCVTAVTALSGQLFVWRGLLCGSSVKDAQVILDAKDSLAGQGSKRRERKCMVFYQLCIAVLISCHVLTLCSAGAAHSLYYGEWSRMVSCLLQTRRS